MNSLSQKIFPKKDILLKKLYERPITQIYSRKSSLMQLVIISPNKRIKQVPHFLIKILKVLVQNKHWAGVWCGLCDDEWDGRWRNRASHVYCSCYHTSLEKKRKIENIENMKKCVITIKNEL